VKYHLLSSLLLNELLMLTARHHILKTEHDALRTDHGALQAGHNALQAEKDVAIAALQRANTELRSANDAEIAARQRADLDQKAENTALRQRLALVEGPAGRLAKLEAKVATASRALPASWSSGFAGERTSQQDSR